MGYEAERRQMVENQLVRRGIADPLVLAAMAKVAREKFLPTSVRHRAYVDGPLPIGGGQTISQPYVVALMIAALELGGGDNVLEIGTGSGYSAAVLGEIAETVETVERLRALAESARHTLQGLGYGNVHVHCGDGSLGLAARAPFDAIVVTAGGPAIAGPLRDQLAPGARLVMPVGRRRTSQRLVRLRRTGPEPGDFEEEVLARVRFVPLIGRRGWPATGTRWVRPRRTR